MSYILISKLTDLKFIIDADIYISESPYGQQEEIYNNTWQISFDKTLSLKLKKTDLENFFYELIERRSKQIDEISKNLPVTFYLWFDQQSSQLCFNLLSGNTIELPFGCTVNIVESFDVILNKCINDIQNSDAAWDQIEIIEPGDPSWDDDEDDDPKKYILDVYVTTLRRN